MLRLTGQGSPQDSHPSLEQSHPQHLQNSPSEAKSASVVVWQGVGMWREKDTEAEGRRGDSSHSPQPSDFFFEPGPIYNHITSPPSWSGWSSSLLFLHPLPPPTLLTLLPGLQSLSFSLAYPNTMHRRSSSGPRPPRPPAGLSIYWVPGTSHSRSTAWPAVTTPHLALPSLACLLGLSNVSVSILKAGSGPKLN